MAFHSCAVHNPLALVEKMKWVEIQTYRGREQSTNVQQQPKRERFVWDNYEINKGIYSFWKK